jgi:hypothetical protein
VLIFVSNKNFITTAWDMSGNETTLPMLPINVDERATEQATHDTLSLQVTAVIESVLPDWMIREEYTDAWALWKKLKGSYSV